MRNKVIEPRTVYTTKNGVDIIVSRGSKKESPYDFRVHYREPNKRMRTPKHIHLIIDLYLKMSKNEELTMKLVDYLISMMEKLEPVKIFPPKLQVYDKEDLSVFNELNNYGEYSVEFLVVVTEFIMIQEKTNYPTGTMNVNLFKKFREKADIFSVVSSATFR